MAAEGAQQAARARDPHLHQVVVRPCHERFVDATLRTGGNAGYEPRRDKILKPDPRLLNPAPSRLNAEPLPRI